MTDTVTVQAPPFAAIVPPERLKLLPPGVAVAVPPQVVAALLGEATVRPLGKLSVKAAFVAALVPVLPSVMVIVDVPVALMVLGANALFTVTAACTPVPMSKIDSRSPLTTPMRITILCHRFVSTTLERITRSPHLKKSVEKLESIFFRNIWPKQKYKKLLIYFTITSSSWQFIFVAKIDSTNPGS
ncbi:hypothetical protein ABE501_13695 [Comamonas testosteroni]